jgi:hypothetical protein
MNDKTISPQKAKKQEEAIRKIMAERGVTFAEAYNIYIGKMHD